MLQTVAWTTMLVGRSQTVTWSEAWQTTFDGRHPCKLCKIVKTGQAAEKQSGSGFELKKLELPMPEQVFRTTAPASLRADVRSATRLAPIPGSAPPVPPPRLG